MATAATSTSSPSSLQFPAPGSSSPHSLPSIRIWPPNPSTRSTLVKRLAGHLSADSFFSQRYGKISPEEALLHAERIEQEAFVAASEHADSESADIAVVQFYAKEASRLMLECLKKGPTDHEEGADDKLQQVQSERSVDSMPRETVFDISDGNREFLSEESASELLKPLADPGNTYSTICLSNRSFGEDAARVAGKILEALRSQLTEVNLADIVAGRNEEEALAVLSIFSSALSGCNLKYLNLSDNALGEKGVRAFSGLLESQKNLEELYFMNNGISEEAAEAIYELLPSSKGLKVLHFHNNMTGDGGAIALSHLVRAADSLEDFRCSSTRVATEGGVALAEALLAGSSLKKLDMRDNPFGVDGGIALAKPLKQHLDLKEVYLSYLGFEDEGAEAVLDALKGAAPGLEVLELAGNELTVNSVEKLVSCIASKINLVKLNLSENDLEDKGVVAVCNALDNGSEQLVELDLSETNIGRIGACAAAQVVALKPGFQLLNLNGNHISEAGIEALKSALGKGTNGTTVLGPLDENDEDEGRKDADEDSENDKEDGDVDDDLQAQFSNVKV
ncbi:hypothetical protein GOP47_0029416 [Adiantum capillus-veneris]|nr:hypothetical protein GOP47_0029416 [Adiantum capillus-veneris]